MCPLENPPPIAPVPSHKKGVRKSNSDSAPHRQTYWSQCTPIILNTSGSQASIKLRIVVSF